MTHHSSKFTLTHFLSPAAIIKIITNCLFVGKF
jgi:hypothetical protein